MLNRYIFVGMDSKFGQFDRIAIFFWGNRNSRHGLQLLLFNREAKVSLKNMRVYFISTHLDVACALGRRDKRNLTI